MADDQGGHAYMMKRLLRDEGGQTMLEYVVIVVFVVVAAIIGFRVVKGTVNRSIKTASYSIERTRGHGITPVEPHIYEQ
jgi:Flp pilus assembly pilin Flp